MGPQPGREQPSPHSSQMQRESSGLPPPLQRTDGVWEDHTLLHEQTPGSGPGAGGRRLHPGTWVLGALQDLGPLTLSGSPGSGKEEGERKRED